MKRLGPWLRLGIVLTVAWALIAPPVMAYRAKADADRFTLMLQSACLETAGRGPVANMSREMTGCTQRSEADLRKNADRLGVGYRNSVSFAFLLAILGWIIGLTLYWSARWILAGRKNI